MKELTKALILKSVIYVARDAERALGLPPTRGYWIVSNDSPAGRVAKKNGANIILIKNKTALDTHELLNHPTTRRFFKKLPQARIVVFKNTKQIEKICAKQGWKLLNPSAELANRVEQKLTQLDWLGALKKYLPPHQVMRCQELKWNRKRFIVQFNHAHTGSGTILIESQKQIDELKNKFPNRESRRVEFISGPVFTNNNIVWGKKVLCGNINYQITGLKPFTDRPFATVGNDWSLPSQILNTKYQIQYFKIAQEVGKRLARDGWKGLFGIDVIMDDKTGKLYLLEINARQPASTTYESQLQENKKTRNPKGISSGQKNKVTTFEAHLAALLGLRDTGYGLREITDGAQVVQRVIASPMRAGSGNPLAAKNKIRRLKDCGFKVIEYHNIKPGEDLLRIQNKKGIMKNHNEFNEIGREIIKSLKN